MPCRLSSPPACFWTSTLAFADARLSHGGLPLRLARGGARALELGRRIDKLALEEDLLDALRVPDEAAPVAPLAPMVPALCSTWGGADARDCYTLKLLRNNGAIHVDLDRVRVAVARRNVRALDRRLGLGPLHLDDGTLGEVDVALLGQRRSADLYVEEQAITLLEHEGMKMM